MLVTGMRWSLVAGTLAAAAALTPTRATAQGDRPVRNWELRGPRFDFRPDGVWRRKVRAIAAARAAALARGDFRTLNAPVQAAGPIPSAYAVTGSLDVPAILIRFKDTDTTLLLGDTNAYTSVLFGTTPPPGRPYTVRTFYEQLSNGLFSMHGNAVGWIPLAQPESLYVGPKTGCSSPQGTCNGVWSNAAYADLVAGLTEAVQRADSMGVDWTRFGYDPATGTLDMVVFIQPMRDGACASGAYPGNNHVWSHRGWLAPVQTRQLMPGSTTVHLNISDYTIQSAVGGAQGCDSTQVMPIGTAAHETGHGLGLPDLYDTGAGSTTEGIGEWGLMGSGNYARPLSPAFYEAWSRTYVGWTTVVPLGAAGAYTFGPVETGDTVFLLRPSGANPRGEYFLLENRQGVNSDSALIARKGSPGLLVWHVDSTQLNAGFGPNTVNAGPIHGVVLVEADGLNELLSTTSPNRGDGGDPFPGTTARTHLGNDAGYPSNRLNAGLNVYAGFVLDSIAQLAPNGPMRFRLSLGALLAVTASDTTAKVRVRGQLTGAFRQYLLQGDTATIGIDSLQTNLAGTARYRFAAWSDGGARIHQVTTTGHDTTLTATLARSFVLAWAAAGPGTVSVAPAASTSGTWYADGDTVGLTARPGPGAIFMGWSGDVTTSTAHVVLAAGRPYSVTANFSAASLDSVVAQLLDGHGLTPLQVLTLDFQGNQNGRFDLGDFLAWLDQSGTAVSAQVLARVFERTRP